MKILLTHFFTRLPTLIHVKFVAGFTSGCSFPLWSHSSAFKMRIRKSTRTYVFEFLIKQQQQLACPVYAFCFICFAVALLLVNNGHLPILRKVFNIHFDAVKLVHLPSQMAKFLLYFRSAVSLSLNYYHFTGTLASERQ